METPTPEKETSCTKTTSPHAKELADLLYTGRSWIDEESARINKRSNINTPTPAKLDSRSKAHIDEEMVRFTKRT